MKDWIDIWEMSVESDIQRDMQTEKAFMKEFVQQDNLIDEIKRLRKKKNAIVLAHFYQSREIQEIADYLGDSLGLAQKAAATKADIIVFAGVHFMAETAKILSPDKKVLLPEPEAGCSLADSCPTESFKEFVKQYPDHKVITYVNTPASIKALSDITCTSTNAVKIINSIPLDENIIFAPDKNLGNYLSAITGRNMVLWDGSCHVHEQFSIKKILELKEKNPELKLLAHPECQEPVRITADFVGSTSALLRFVKSDKSNQYIVATDSGIIHQMQKHKPEKQFIPAPGIDSTCGCSDCEFMKMNTLQKILGCLKSETPEINLSKELIENARLPIERMLELS